MMAYRIMVEVRGYFETHTDELEYDEASELMSNLKSYFPDDVYRIEPYEYEEKEEKEERTYNENAVDGWEDIYPLDDY